MSLNRFQPKLSGQDGQSKRKLVLYVEDEDVNWEVTEFSLRSEYELVRAMTAKEAFAAIKKQSFDIILMDIQLSGSAMNGIEITRALKGLHEGPLPDFAQGIQTPDTTILFVTAYSARYSKEELSDAGGDDLITKPVDFTRLSLVLSRLVVRNAFSKHPGSSTPPKELRVAHRVPAELPIKAMHTGTSTTGTLQNVTLSGAKLSLPDEEARADYTLGSQCELKIKSPWGPLDVVCTVIYVLGPPDNFIGVRFDLMSKDCKHIFERWLHEH